jgi:hypothetical protein
MSGADARQRLGMLRLIGMEKLKTINFTCKEVLPSLLDKSKCQTIRPAWQKVKIIDDAEIQNVYLDGGKLGVDFIEKKSHKSILPKPAKFKVGDKAEIVWNEKSKYEWFGVDFGQLVTIDHTTKELDDADLGFSMCCQGMNPEPPLPITERIPLYEDIFSFPTEEDAYRKYEELLKRTDFRIFKKFLGVVEITEVFKISFGKTKTGTLYMGFDDKKIINKTDEFAKIDGFKSAKEMFKYFDKQYDLSTPKEFWIYRWKWV